jgi:hypothetical protein
MRSSLIFVLALFLGRAHAINRVGNNDDVAGVNGELHDDVEGFTAAIPKEFPNVNSLKDRSAQLMSIADAVSSQLDDGFSLPLAIFAYPLSAAYPQLADASEQQVRDYMSTQLHAQVSEIARQDCGYFLLGENPQGFIGIGKWNNHGYFMSVPRSAQNSGRDGIINILKSTKIETPCKP